jgi:hypothetical protein
MEHQPKAALQPSQTIHAHWRALFPGVELGDWQLDYWADNYTPEIAIESLDVAARKHERLSQQGEPMTVERFCSFATGVMRNKDKQKDLRRAVLPMPRNPAAMEGRFDGEL